MVFVTGLSGVSVVINDDLIEHAEATPDTVITLTTGNKFVVQETLDELAAKVLAFRRAIVAGQCMEVGPNAEKAGNSHA